MKVTLYKKREFVKTINVRDQELLNKVLPHLQLGDFLILTFNEKTDESQLLEELDKIGVEHD